MAYKNVQFCVERAYAALFIPCNTVLINCEIKSAIRAVQAYELYSPSGILASWIRQEVVLMSVLYLTHSHYCSYHFQSIKESFR